MADVSESLICNFTMLSQNLYDLFIQYIIDGRKRAPPETVLLDMLPTFQLGAKTDRRALQSKFKSWAKRMKVENGILKLTSTNKEIVPIEKCPELVMRVHFDGHKSVDKVISKIEENYTWTKKNFGMDRFMILQLISTNCSNSYCRLQIINELAKREQHFMKNMITSSECHIQTLLSQIPPVPQNETTLINSPLYGWPAFFPMANTENNFACNFQEKTLIPQRQSFSGGLISETNSEIIKNKPCISQTVPQCCSTLKTPPRPFVYRRKLFSSSSTFRKPKYIHEFKALVRAAENLSAAYPSILNESKTKFLGSLELVPKKICSKKTLLKFEREKKRKKILEKQHLMCHKNRKNLRDRNKLNKIKLKQQLEKRAYLDVSGSKKCLLPSSSFAKSDRIVTNKEKYDDDTVDSEIEVVKTVTPEEKLKIIQITSSTNEEYNLKRVAGFKKHPSDIIKQQHVIPYKTDKKDFISSKLHRALINNSTGEKSAYTIAKLFQKSPIDLCYNKTKPANSKPPIIPSNLKSEVAVIPPSLKTYRQSKQPNVTERFKKIQPKVSFAQKKTIPIILKPIIDVKDLKLEGKTFANSDFIEKLPTDTNIFLVEKAENGNYRKIPYKSLNSSIKSEISEESKVQRITSPIITAVSSSHSTKSTDKKPSLLEKRLIKMKILESKKKSMQLEVSKLSMWIKRMKIFMIHNISQFTTERSTQKLQSQINIGIALVRSIRRKLIEIEKMEGIKHQSETKKE